MALSTTCCSPAYSILCRYLPILSNPLVCVQVLVLYHDAGTQLSDLTGLIAPLVDKVLLPVAHYVGFKAEYPGHRSKGAQIHSSSSSSTSGGDGSSGSSHGHEEL